MCGITGVFSFKNEGEDYYGKVQQSVTTLKQRGPDSDGIFKDKNVCLGHTRLSIIDLSVEASQPMTDETGRYTIIFNGEIYNYKELRAKLIAKGLPLKRNSDTEVILYSYILEGAKCVDKFDGFFAFAIYDSREETFFVARDRMGIKPLLYYYDKNKFLFASEMKALIELGIPKEIDNTSLSQYFQFTYIPTPHTIFKGVKKLVPGNCVLIKENRVEIKSYFKIPYNRSVRNGISYDNAKVELQRLIEKSVKNRLLSDVPLGSFLSGGVDSSVIVAEASKYVDKLNTFSIGYADEPYFDETRYAELVAAKFNTNHQTFKLTNDDLYESLHNVLDYIDEPFADSSALPVHILSMYTRRYVTVSLSGDGADELFSGYNKHHAHYYAMKGGVKSALLKVGSPLWNALPKSRNSKFSNTVRQLQRYADGLKLDEKDRYWHWASFFNQNYVNDILKDEVSLNELQIRKNEILKEIKPSQSISDILYADLNLVLVSDMLHKVDSMSMANALEVRTPFLNHELVAFVMSLPDEYKINSNMRKRILQDTYRNILPNEIYQRPKHGFEVPLLKWFRTELKQELYDNVLNPDMIREQGVFNVKEISLLRDKLNSNNPGDVQAQLWAMLVFQNWWEKYMG